MSRTRTIKKRLISAGITLGGIAVMLTFLAVYIPAGFDSLLVTIKENFEESHPATSEPVDGIPAQLIRVVDGDTIAVTPTEALPATNDAGTEHVVRLLSIDAPEMNKMSSDPAECGAQEATDHLAGLIGDGAQLTLTFDSRSDHTDRYGRSLAYVHTVNGDDLASAMVRDGFAEAWYPNSEPAPERFDSYAALQFEAAAAGAGSYSLCDTIGR